MLDQLIRSSLASLGIDRAKGEAALESVHRVAAQVGSVARALMVEHGAAGDTRGIKPHNPLDIARVQSGTIAAGDVVRIVASELVGRDYGTVAEVRNRDTVGAGGTATLIVRGMNEDTYSIPLDPGAIEDLTGEVWKEITIQAPAGGSAVAYVVKAR